MSDPHLNFVLVNIILTTIILCYFNLITISISDSGSLLSSTKKFHDSDLSLLSWLQSIPSETFVHPFEQRTLDVDVERLEKPSLETSWTEHMRILNCIFSSVELCCNFNLFYFSDHPH